MAIAATSLPRFLLTQTLLRFHDEVNAEDVQAALDLLDVPAALRAIDADEPIVEITRWTDPALPDPNPNVYRQRLNPSQIRARYGA